MTRGRKRTPTAILKMNGSRKAKGRSDPEPPPGKPTMPRDMAPAAKRIWQRVIPMLDHMGVLTKIEVDVLRRYCEGMAQWIALCKDVSKNGMTEVCHNAKGDVTKSQRRPEAVLMLNLSEQLLRFEREFGMTPSSRASIKVAAEKKQPKDDPAQVIRKLMDRS